VVAADSTVALAFGGTPPVKDETEEWEGSSWTEVADLSTARVEVMGAGTQPSALAIGGNSGSVTNATEEWTKAVAAVTFTSS